jgi:hypothetical protein
MIATDHAAGKEENKTENPNDFWKGFQRALHKFTPFGRKISLTFTYRNLIFKIWRQNDALLWIRIGDCKDPFNQ